jgi:hypothetical protein
MAATKDHTPNLRSEQKTAGKERSIRRPFHPDYYFLCTGMTTFPIILKAASTWILNRRFVMEDFPRRSSVQILGSRLLIPPSFFADHYSSPYFHADNADSTAADCPRSGR